VSYFDQFLSSEGVLWQVDYSFRSPSAGVVEMYDMVFSPV